MGMTISQRSFGSGELAPSLYGRCDTQKYSAGLRTLRNFYTKRHGGVSNRAGTEFIAQAGSTSSNIRMIPYTWLVNGGETQYLLVLEDLAIRFLTDLATEPTGGFVKTNTVAQAITAITNANPGVVTYVGADFSNGDRVLLQNIVGAIGTYLNGRICKVANVNAGANTFELQDINGVNINTTSYGSYTSGGEIFEEYTAATDFATAALPDLKAIQKDTLMTMVHADYQPRVFRKTVTGPTTHQFWSLYTSPEGLGILGASAPSDLFPWTNFPALETTQNASVGAVNYRYRVTVLNSKGEESLSGFATALSITSITRANPCVITLTALPASERIIRTGDEVYLANITGMTELNRRYVTATYISDTSFSINVNSTSFGVFTSGAIAVYQTTVGAWQRAVLGGTEFVNIRITNQGPAYNVAAYRIYKASPNKSATTSGSVYGLLATVAANSTDDYINFQDDGTLDPDISQQPPTNVYKFSATGDYPSAVAYVQQRQAFGGSDNNPSMIDMSKVRVPQNFSHGFPILDDDPSNFELVAQKSNRVQHLLDIGGKLAVFTDAGEWVVNGDAEGVITPSSPNPKQQSTYGSNTLTPIAVGEGALFCQRRGQAVRDLAFDISVNGYRGNEVSIFSSHLLEGKEIVSWAFQKLPHSVVWMVLDDGSVLGLTYVKEQQVFAWHRHDFGGGLAKSVEVVEETDYDALYFVIERTINGYTKKYIEKMSNREAADIDDLNLVDCAKIYDGRNTGVRTMTITTGTTYVAGQTLTMTASSSFFTSADVGKGLIFHDDDGNRMVFTIVGYTGVTVVTGTCNVDIPTELRNTATTEWALAVSQITNLWHLEGEDVSIFADGFVLSSPLNSNYATKTVTLGLVTLGGLYGVVKVGLPITCDLETLDIDTANGETISDKNKLIKFVNLDVEASRGIFVGPKPPEDHVANTDDADALYGLYEYKAEDPINAANPIALVSKTIEVPLAGEWNSNGRAFVRQVDPLPITINAIHPQGELPFQRGS